jgi:hypothetical protein
MGFRWTIVQVSQPAPAHTHTDDHAYNDAYAFTYPITMTFDESLRYEPKVTLIPTYIFA